MFPNSNILEIQECVLIQSFHIVSSKSQNYFFKLLKDQDSWDTTKFIGYIYFRLIK